MCDNMEDIYSIQTLIQVLISLLVLCTCMFLLATATFGSKLFFVELLYISAVQYQLFLYCWFGNELTLAHDSLTSALYESDWFSTNKSFKTSLLITMIKMKKPLALTVGKFTPLTLNTLVAIARGSYSLFALLKNRDSVQQN